MKSTLKEKLEKRLGMLGVNDREILESIGPLCEIVEEWVGPDLSSQNWRWDYLFAAIPEFHALHPGNAIEALNISRYLEIIRSVNIEKLQRLVLDFQDVVPLIESTSLYSKEEATKFLTRIRHKDDPIRKQLIETGDICLVESGVIAPFSSQLASLLPGIGGLDKKIMPLREKLLDFKIELFNCLSLVDPLRKIEGVLAGIEFSDREKSILYTIDFLDLKGARDKRLKVGGVFSAVKAAIFTAFEIRESLGSHFKIELGQPRRTSEQTPPRVISRGELEEMVADSDNKRESGFNSPEYSLFTLLSRGKGIDDLIGFHESRVTDYLDRRCLEFRRLLALLPPEFCEGRVSFSGDWSLMFIDESSRPLMPKQGKFLKILYNALPAGVKTSDALRRAGYSKDADLVSSIRDKDILQFIRAEGRGRHKLFL